MSSWQTLKNQPSFSSDTMLLLTDGTVMVHELNTANWHRLTPDSSGSYLNGSWSPLASLPDNSNIPANMGGPTNAPLFFASAVLKDGTVFVAGGEYNTGKDNADVLAAQVYDPVSNTWAAVATPAGWSGIGDAPSCVLPDGRLLLGNFESSATAIFDPTTQTWAAGGQKTDSCSEETFTLLPNGNVLAVECSNAPNAEQYVPSQGMWISVGMTGATLPQSCTGLVAEIGPALTLPDGRVFAVGATGATALYTPNADPNVAGTWANGPTLKDAQGNTSYPMDVPAVLLPNGKVLVLGAPGPPCNYPSPTTVFLYDPASNTATVIPGPSIANGAPYGARLLLLPNGQVMYSASRKEIAVYVPDPGGESSWKPTITDFPELVFVGQTYPISGTQFNGLSQACSYGDDAQMATNYPIVRVQSGGKVYYLRTSNHSTMAIATGATNVSTNIYVPTNVPAGNASLVVVANGIASDPVSVSVRGLSGTLLSYGDAGTPGNVSDPVIVGFGGWSPFQFLFAGRNAAGQDRIYAVNANGQLLSYGDSGTPGNVSDPVTVGLGGWSPFKFLFAGRNAAGQDRIYAVNGNGQLLSYGDSGTPGNVSDPVIVGFGGWQAFKFLFAGRNAAGQDRIYAVNGNGQLLSYGDSGTPGNVSDPVVVGFGGWSPFKFLFAGRNAAGQDRIYAVNANAELLSYGDSGTPGNVSDPVVVGFGGWLPFKFLFAGRNAAAQDRIYGVPD